MVKAVALFLVLSAPIVCAAQDTLSPVIHTEEVGDSLRFSAGLRPLRQLAGAPAAYYSYFWELGDGRFSFEKSPQLSYRDTGIYQVRLFATNNYDDGKAPTARPRPVRVRRKGTGVWASHFFHGDGSIEMKLNRNPKPGENFVALIGYRNQQAGSIVLFYNERQFARKGFALADERTYHGETPSSMDALIAGLPWAGGNDVAFGGPRAELEEPMAASTESLSILHTLQNQFSQNTVVRFPALNQGQEKFVFVEMTTLPEMIKDTNTTVSLIAMLVPDQPGASPEVCELDVPIVSSHDPNRMQLIHRRINYRFMGDKKELRYRVSFQNTGKGPTHEVSIGVRIPPELNGQSIQLRALSPYCPWCDSIYKGHSCLDTFRRGDSIYFVLHDIYLPGLQQGIVSDPDSTKGVLEFSIRFKRKPKKIPFRTDAAIAFDGNAPLVTNPATARFIKGISPGIMVGYNFLPGQGRYSASGPLQVGYVLAPFSPFRPYFQAEFSVTALEQEKDAGVLVQVNKDTSILGSLYVLTGRQKQTVTKRNSLEATPLHFRYNLNDWIGVGVGATARISLTEQVTTTDKAYFQTQLPPLSLMTAATTVRSSTHWIGSWDAEPFVDIQVGRVRTGPVVGLRYLRPLQGNLSDRFFLYAGFKL